MLKKVEGILAKTEGVQYYTTIGGFSLLNRISASNQGFFFISFKPWDERTSNELQARAIVDKVNGALASPGARSDGLCLYATINSGTRQRRRFLALAPGSQRWVRRISRPEPAEDSSTHAASVRSWLESLHSFPLPYRKSSRMWIATKR